MERRGRAEGQRGHDICWSVKQKGPRLFLPVKQRGHNLFWSVIKWGHDFFVHFSLAFLAKTYGYSWKSQNQ